MGSHRKQAVCALLFSIFLFHLCLLWPKHRLFAFALSLLVLFALWFAFECISKGGSVLDAILRRNRTLFKKDANTTKNNRFCEQVDLSIVANTRLLWSWSAFFAICGLIEVIPSIIALLSFQCTAIVILVFLALTALHLSSRVARAGKIYHFGILTARREEQEIQVLRPILFKLVQLVFVGPLIALVFGLIWFVRWGAIKLFDIFFLHRFLHLRDSFGLWANVLVFPLTLLVAKFGCRILLGLLPERISLWLSLLVNTVFSKIRNWSRSKQAVVRRKAGLLAAVVPLLFVVGELFLFHIVVFPAANHMTPDFQEETDASAHAVNQCHYSSICRRDNNESAPSCLSPHNFNRDIPHSSLSKNNILDRGRSNSSNDECVALAQFAHTPRTPLIVRSESSMRSYPLIASSINQEMDRKLAVADLSSVYAEEMIATWRDRENDELVRNFAVQHLERYARECVVRGTWNPDASDAADVRAALEEAVLETGTSVGGAALLALARLSEIDPHVDRTRLGARASALVSAPSAPAANRASAAQVCGLLRVRSALPALRSLSSDSSAPTPLRLAAQHAAEEIEGR